MSENDKQFDEENQDPEPRLIDPVAGLERPPTRHSSRRQAREQMQYGSGSMQDQLRRAAELRAQRAKKDMDDLADSETSQEQTNIHNNQETNDASNESDEIEQVSAAGPPEINPWTDEELGFNQEQANILDPPVLNNMQQASELRRNREEQALEAVGDETWYSCFSIPTPEWRQRKCNLYMHGTAALIVLLVDTPGCHIPLTTWLSVYFFLLVVETMTVEYRGRMSNSPYYQHYRRARKIIQNGMVVAKEICEAIWVIYGITLYYSDGANGCSDQNRGFIIIMAMFLLLGVLKLVLFLVVLGIMIYIFVASRLRKRKARNASVAVLRSIQKIRYQNLAGDAANTEEECIICYMEYTDDDIVSRLQCNDKHVFHTECIEGWIRQGKNSCPVCRAPINESIEL